MKKRILVVDDVATVREPIAQALASVGYRTLQAESCQKALKCLESSVSQIHLVLLDYAMPGTSGLEFLKQIRKTPDWQQIPVIMLTDFADREIVAQAAKLGVNSYCLKSSFRMDELLKLIKNELTGHPTEITVDTQAATHRKKSGGRFR